ncbi:uncharacterized protein LOC106051876 isoform X1 [Biomphalaria glabrata]|uniref:Uncharacterized protein LOC106051876 isoform X1 n=1 Tax=Biomphalaria glabrata TaxID=6526 RepID=A0A9U8DW00_BIOGL|nr:uncharacterized protein LOC106051876 isoform X1 [Biomphalaria glabrata]
MKETLLLYARHSISCQCLQDNVFLESLIIVLTLVSGLAITGKNLLLFNLITVPQTEEITDITNVTSLTTKIPSGRHFHENVDVLHLLDQIFRYTSFAVAALFAAEIFIKIITLRKTFLTKPWQVFDGLVVAGALGVEIAFYCVGFTEPGLQSVKYVVMLRLWRIPFVCSIRSQALQQNLEEDLERYKLDSKEKISQMQDTIAQQNERIQFLQTMVEKQTKKSASSTNIKMRHKSSEDTDDANKQLQYSPAIKNSAISKKKHKQQSSESSVSEDFQRETTGTIKNSQDTIYNRDNAESNIENDPFQSDEAVVMRIPRSEASYDLKEAAERPKQMPSRPRKRCSSTSEYMEYGSMSSPEHEFAVLSDKTKSDSRTSISNDDLRSRGSNENIGLDNHSYLASDTLSDVNTDSLQGRKTRQNRLSSCPEYVFTQRMTITNEESKLISDGSVIDDPSMYDNMAFSSEEQIGLHILAEFDGVKTYCNENGIPMTSL